VIEMKYCTRCGAQIYADLNSALNVEFEFNRHKYPKWHPYNT
jgi:transposase